MEMERQWGVETEKKATVENMFLYYKNIFKKFKKKLLAFFLKIYYKQRI